MKHPLVPTGWDVEVEGDTLRISSPPGGPGFMVLHAHARSLPERLLYALAVDLTTNPFPPEELEPGRVVEVARDEDLRIVGIRHESPPALTQVLDGLLASLGREPTEAELRAAAHSLTVRADRIALARPAYRGA